VVEMNDIVGKQFNEWCDGQSDNNWEDITIGALISDGIISGLDNRHLIVDRLRMIEYTHYSQRKVSMIIRSIQMRHTNKDGYIESCIDKYNAWDEKIKMFEKQLAHTR
jgi:hypothetical protein